MTKLEWTINPTACDWTDLNNSFLLAKNFQLFHPINSGRMRWKRCQDSSARCQHIRVYCGLLLHFFLFEFTCPYIGSTSSVTTNVGERSTSRNFCGLMEQHSRSDTNCGVKLMCECLLQFVWMMCDSYEGGISLHIFFLVESSGNTVSVL